MTQNGIETNSDEVLNLIKNKISSDVVPDTLNSKFANSDFEKSSINRDVLSDECLSMSDIENIILKTEPADNGGVIAMSGFYYQLLVTIDYLIEMFNGKWTNVVVDYHQDIIAYNSEKKIIRFIQVKTKKAKYANYVPVSDTNAYSEWIPKLLTNYHLFEGKGYKLEFELVSNCCLTNASRACDDFEQYHENNKFENGSIGGKLYKRIKEKEGEYNLSDEIIKNGLKAFKFTHIPAEDYEERLAGKIGKLFYSGTFKANQNDIELCIVHLFRKCYMPDSASIQIVRDAELKKLMESIQHNIQLSGERVSAENSVDRALGNFIDKVREFYQSANFITDLETVIDEFETEIKKQINSSNVETISTILNKFIAKKSDSTYFRLGKDDEIKSESKKLFDVLLFLKIYFEGQISVDSDSRKLLMVDIVNNNFNLFGEKRGGGYIDERIKEFKEVFQNLSPEVQFSIVSNKRFKVVFSGSYINDYDEELSVEINFKDIPSNENLGINDKIVNISKVSEKIQVIDANTSKIEEIGNRHSRMTNIDEMKSLIGEKFRL